MGTSSAPDDLDESLTGPLHIPTVHSSFISEGRILEKCSILAATAGYMYDFMYALSGVPWVSTCGDGRVLH